MDRLKNLEYIINYLKAEDIRLSELPIPSDLKDRQQMMRAMLNIREPEPISEDFLKAQDAELQMQKEDKGVVQLNAGSFTSLPFYPFTFKDSPFNFKLWQGDITRLAVDAIVNAANCQMLGCFHPLHNCIDNAIHSAAGVELRIACNNTMQQRGKEANTSDAIITRGYNLPAKYVIHTVGPIIPNGVPTRGQEVQLANCYRHCLELADEYHLHSIAFCCISTGVFLFPPKRAAEIAVSSVHAWLTAHKETSINTVVFNVFKDSDYNIYKSLVATPTSAS